MACEIHEHVCRTARHTSFYLACGAPYAQPIVFVHGWPDLAIGWRHQLQCFAALGFRAIAPDMRGYGRSTVHPAKSDYAIEHSVADMIELLDHLGRCLVCQRRAQHRARGALPRRRTTVDAGAVLPRAARRRL